MVTKEEARKYLGDAVPEQCFWVNNGPILKNLDDLASALPSMDENTFTHHVNKEKNDFSNWINEVIGDKKLANDLLSSRNRGYSLKKLINRLNSLKKKAT